MRVIRWLANLFEDPSIRRSRRAKRGGCICLGYGEGGIIYGQCGFHLKLAKRERMAWERRIAEETQRSFTHTNLGPTTAPPIRNDPA